MNPDLNADLKELDATLTTIEKVVDVDELSDRIRELEAQALSLIHISEPTRLIIRSRMPSSA